jgi:hypothetical protein
MQLCHVDVAAYRGALDTWNWRAYGPAAVPAVFRHAFSREGPSVRLFHDQYVTCIDTGVNYHIAFIAGEGNPQGENNRYRVEPGYNDLVNATPLQ